MVVLSDGRHLYIYKFESNKSMLSRLIFSLKSVNFLFLFSIFIFLTKVCVFLCYSIIGVLMGHVLKKNLPVCILLTHNASKLPKMEINHNICLIAHTMDNFTGFLFSKYNTPNSYFYKIKMGFTRAMHTFSHFILKHLKYLLVEQ